MIPQTETLRQADTVAAEQLPTESWQQALANAVSSASELFELLRLDPAQLPAAVAASKDFALRVPRGFVARMTPGDWHDPLLQQVLPQAQELDFHAGFSADPLQEASSNPAPGLIHKYHGRVLLVVSGGCAINCRYCFRRHFPYSDNNPGRKQWQQTLDYIRNDSSIHEVIFSGGDPLAASDSLLAELVASIADIAHVTTLRVHSRLPIVIPQRITAPCLAWLSSSRLKVVMVIHANHANEIDGQTGQILLKLRAAGITVLNQSVLLAGVNDNAAALAALSHRLFEFGVLPYYLHLLDRVQGAAHFQRSKQHGQQLIQQLLAILPGYLVPKLVQELPGARSKVPVDIPILPSEP
jgi:EF-P beta-lysylation protein EpmB